MGDTVETTTDRRGWTGPGEPSGGALAGTHDCLLASGWRAALAIAGLPYSLVADPGQTAPPDLLDQQLWVWGKDVYAEQGNALIRHGFTRCGCPDDQNGSTQYRRVADGLEVRLWGFGLYWAPTDHAWGVLLRRYAAGPVVLPVERMPEHAWKAAHLPRPLALNAGSARCALGLVAGACTWIAAYECWAWATLGARHRRAVLAAWHKARIVPAGRMSAAWRRLARALRQVKREGSAVSGEDLNGLRNN